MSATTTERPSIDPRLRDRRVAVLRAQGRRRLRVVIALLATAMVLGSAWLLLSSPVLDVDRVTIDGARGGRIDEVAVASGIELGDPVLFVDLGGAALAIERLPWVDDARVERSLPASVTITVTRRTAVAWIAVPAAAVTTAGFATVDGTGRVLEIVDAAPAGLPELTGITTVPEPGLEVEPAAPAEALNGMPAELLALAASVRVENGSATLVLDDGVEVRIGELTDLETKGRVALAVLESLTAPIAYLDVQVPAVPVTG
jgi:cell division protein FtsQ